MEPKYMGSAPAYRGEFSDGGQPVNRPTRQPAINAAFARLAEELDCLEKAAESLTDRLSPVLHQQPQDKASNGVGPAPPPTCELEERVLQLAAKASRLSAMLRRAEERVEL